MDVPIKLFIELLRTAKTCSIAPYKMSKQSIMNVRRLVISILTPSEELQEKNYEREADKNRKQTTKREAREQLEVEKATYCCSKPTGIICFIRGSG